MTETKKDDGQSFTFTKKARAVFCNAIIPKKIGEKGAPVFSLTLVEIDKADIDAMRQIAAAVAKAEWPGRQLIVNREALTDPRNLQFPFKNGDERAAQAVSKGKDGAFFQGQVVFDTRSGEEYPPFLSVLQGKKIVDLDDVSKLTLGKQKFYNGCYVVPKVRFKAYKSQTEGGIGAYSGVKAFLSSVLWVADGPRIGGSSAETFRAYVGGLSDVDPTGAGSDEIPY